MQKTQDKPLAAKGLISYRYPTSCGNYCMIGAKNNEEALREAARSTWRKVFPEKLEIWNGKEYVKSTPTQSNFDNSYRRICGKKK